MTWVDIGSHHGTGVYAMDAAPAYDGEDLRIVVADGRMAAPSYWPRNLSTEPKVVQRTMYVAFPGHVRTNEDLMEAVRRYEVKIIQPTHEAGNLHRIGA